MRLWFCWWILALFVNCNCYHRVVRSAEDHTIEVIADHVHEDSENIVATGNGAGLTPSSQRERRSTAHYQMDSPVNSMYEERFMYDEKIQNPLYYARDEPRYQPNSQDNMEENDNMPADIENMDDGEFGKCPACEDDKNWCRYGYLDCNNDIVKAKCAKYCKQCAESMDGQFGPWTKFSNCSEKCGLGIRMRTRECNNPAPCGPGAKDCDGPAFDSVPCMGLPENDPECNDNLDPCDPEDPLCDDNPEDPDPCDPADPLCDDNPEDPDPCDPADPLCDDNPEEPDVPLESKCEPVLLTDISTTQCETKEGYQAMTCGDCPDVNADIEDLTQACRFPSVDLMECMAMIGAMEKNGQICKAYEFKFTRSTMSTYCKKPKPKKPVYRNYQVPQYQKPRLNYATNVIHQVHQNAPYQPTYSLPRLVYNQGHQKARYQPIVDKSRRLFYQPRRMVTVLHRRY